MTAQENNKKIESDAYSKKEFEEATLSIFNNLKDYINVISKYYKEIPFNENEILNKIREGLYFLGATIESKECQNMQSKYSYVVNELMEIMTRSASLKKSLKEFSKTEYKSFFTIQHNYYKNIYTDLYVSIDYLICLDIINITK